MRVKAIFRLSIFVYWISGLFKDHDEFWCVNWDTIKTVNGMLLWILLVQMTQSKMHILLFGDAKYHMSLFPFAFIDTNMDELPAGWTKIIEINRVAGR